MIFKAGVKTSAVKPELLIALVVADKISDRVRQAEMVITSLNDGKHKKGSLHYQGFAADIRTHGIKPFLNERFVTALELALGPDYDVLLEYLGTEDEHIHLEYDPTTVTKTKEKLA